MIARRLGRLSAQAIEWLRVAAVIGRDFDAALLERVLGLDEDEFLDALEEALAAGLVVEAAAGRGPLQLLARADPRDALRGDVGAAPGADPPAGGRGARGSAAREQRTDARSRTTSPARPGREDAEKAIALRLAARREQATAMLAHEEAGRALRAGARGARRASSPRRRERRCELLLALGEARVRAGERPLALGGVPRGGRARRAARRRRQPRPGGDRRLAALHPAARRGRRRADRAARAGAGELTAGEQSVTAVRLLARLCGALYYSPERDRMQALSREATATRRRARRSRGAGATPPRRAGGPLGPGHLRRAAGDLDRDADRCARGRRPGARAPGARLAGRRPARARRPRRGRRPDRGLRRPAPSGCASRCYRGTRRSGGRCGRCSPASSSAAERAGRRGAGDRAPAEAVTAPQYYAIQLLAIRREQGRMAELEARRARARRQPTRTGRRGARARRRCCARPADARRPRPSSTCWPRRLRGDPAATATG